MKFAKRLKRSLGGIFLASFCMAGCMNTKTCLRNDDTHWMSSDSLINNQLGSNLSEILFSPDSVKCYHIAYKDSIEKKEIQFTRGYVRDNLITILDEQQTAILQYILLSNKESYSKDSMKIEAPYMPIMEYKFQKEGHHPASVILSISDRSWSIFYDGKQLFNYNYIDSRVVERFCDYFLDIYDKNMVKE